MTNWRPIATAPRDGTPIDVWCIPDEDEFPEWGPEQGGIRLTEVFWHDADSISPYTGWMRCCDDGDWDGIESKAICQFGLPPWHPTHWLPLPEPPKDQAHD